MRHSQAEQGDRSRKMQGGRQAVKGHHNSAKGLERELVGPALQGRQVQAELGEGQGSNGGDHGSDEEYVRGRGRGHEADHRQSLERRSIGEDSRPAQGWLPLAPAISLSLSLSLLLLDNVVVIFLVPGECLLTVPRGCSHVALFSGTCNVFAVLVMIPEEERRRRSYPLAFPLSLYTLWKATEQLIHCSPRILITRQMPAFKPHSLSLLSLSLLCEFNRFDIRCRLNCAGYLCPQVSGAPTPATFPSSGGEAAIIAGGTSFMQFG